jgi:hypothetical protein
MILAVSVIIPRATAILASIAIRIDRDDLGARDVRRPAIRAVLRGIHRQPWRTDPRVVRSRFLPFQFPAHDVACRTKRGTAKPLPDPIEQEIPLRLESQALLDLGLDVLPQASACDFNGMQLRFQRFELRCGFVVLHARIDPGARLCVHCYHVE